MNISQVYNYLNHDLVPKRRTRTHKASELKAVYNSISKYNQSSPLSSGFPLGIETGAYD